VTLGSFEAWARVIGGIFDAAGIVGFLGNQTDFYEQADTQTSMIRMLVKEWAARFGTSNVKAADLFTIWTELEGLDEKRDPTKPKSDRAERTRFGKMLSGYRDRVIEGSRIARAGREHGAALWCLQKPKVVAAQPPANDAGEHGERGERFSPTSAVCFSIADGVIECSPRSPCSPSACCPRCGEDRLGAGFGPERVCYVCHAESRGEPPPGASFMPTDDWQDVPPGAVLPNGVELEVTFGGGQRVRLPQRPTGVCSECAKNRGATETEWLWDGFMGQYRCTTCYPVEERITNE
jgi:hypothetical protein